MTPWQRIAIGAVVAAVVLAAWLGRYDIEQAGSGPGVFRLDRWTGTVWIFGGFGAHEIQPTPP